MSGAAALAAARRRRAAPQPNNPPPPVARSNYGGPNQLKPPNHTVVSQEQMGQQPIVQQRIHPTTMLMNHGKIIENLQTVVTDLNNKMDNDMMDKKETTKFVSDITEEAIKNLNITENNLEFFRTKYKNMEIQLNELKKHIIKVQTFAMETSLQTIELKKKLYRNGQLNTMLEVSNSDTNKLEVSAESHEEFREISENIKETNEVLHDNSVVE